MDFQSALVNAGVARKPAAIKKQQIIVSVSYARPWTDSNSTRINIGCTICGQNDHTDRRCPHHGK